MGSGGRIDHQSHPVAPTAPADPADPSPASTGDVIGDPGDRPGPVAGVIQHLIEVGRTDGLTIGQTARRLTDEELVALPDAQVAEHLARGLDAGANSREIAETLVRADQAGAGVAQQRAAAMQSLAEVVADHEQSQAAAAAARDRAHEGPEDSDGSYLEHPELFQAAYDQARERMAAGQGAVPYMTEDATGGLGSREGGRGFGVELEFDFPGSMAYSERSAAIAAIGQDLHAAGLSPVAHQVGYHASLRDGYTDAPGAWRLESDSTVAGEIVSPIMYDEPATWANLAQVTEIVRRHGGVASRRTGGHVHVGLHDYDHTVENHNRLMQTVAAYEDVLYRLSHNPERGEHRGTQWCRPNLVPTAGYEDVGRVARNNSGHGLGVNLQSVSGRASDHAEFRMWDGSLEPSVIQTQIKVSLGLADHALRTAGSPSPLGGERHGLGSHRRQWGRRRQSGEAWRASTRVFRDLADRIFARPEDRAQAASLFAATRWQGLRA